MSNKKKQIKSQSAMGKVIEADIEYLKVYLEDYSLGELSNLKNHLTLQFQEVETIKDALINQKKQAKAGEDLTLVDKTLGDLYLVMQKIEERCELVEILKKNKTPNVANQ